MNGFVSECVYSWLGSRLYFCGVVNPVVVVNYHHHHQTFRTVAPPFCLPPFLVITRKTAMATETFDLIDLSVCFRSFVDVVSGDEKTVWVNSTTTTPRSVRKLKNVSHFES